MKVSLCTQPWISWNKGATCSMALLLKRWCYRSLISCCSNSQCHGHKHPVSHEGSLKGRYLSSVGPDTGLAVFCVPSWGSEFQTQQKQKMPAMIRSYLCPPCGQDCKYATEQSHRQDIQLVNTNVITVPSTSYSSQWELSTDVIISVGYLTATWNKVYLSKLKRIQ